MVLSVVPLDARRHDRAGFACGESTLDAYLHQLAAQHQRSGVATTHVLVDTDAPARILGYYALSAAQLLLTELTEADRRRLPAYPVLGVRIGRLAVALIERGRGHGAYLLGDAVARCLSLRKELGVRVLVVDALHAEAAAFYRAFGFRDCTGDGRTLYLPLGT